MSDIVDQSQPGEEAFIAERLEKQRLAAGLDRPGSPTCADCGGGIPAERRKAMPSAIRCVDCQAWSDRREQQGRFGR